MANEEMWMDIVGFPLYQISNYGRVKSFGVKKKGGMMCAHKDKDGYVRVPIYNVHMKQKNIFVHRLIALAFIPNPNNYPQLNHIDGNKENNTIDNLEWCTPSQNMKHKFILNPDLQKGEAHSHAKITKDDVLKIYNESWEGNLSVRQIAEKHNVNRATVTQIKNGKQWTIVTKHDIPHLPRSSFKGELNPSAKLTAKHVLEIYKRVCVKELTLKAMSNEYGISISAISKIKNGTSWNSITNHHKNTSL